MKTLRRNSESRGDTAVPQRELLTRPVDIFGLYRSLRRKILKIPGNFTVDLGRASMKLWLASQDREFTEIADGMILAGELGMLKVLQASGKVDF